MGQLTQADQGVVLHDFTASIVVVVVVVVVLLLLLLLLLLLFLFVSCVFGVLCFCASVSCALCFVLCLAASLVSCVLCLCLCVRALRFVFCVLFSALVLFLFVFRVRVLCLVFCVCVLHFVSSSGLKKRRQFGGISASHSRSSLPFGRAYPGACFPWPTMTGRKQWRVPGGA